MPLGALIDEKSQLSNGMWQRRICVSEFSTGIVMSVTYSTDFDAILGPVLRKKSRIHVG
jgi:hypothetical protein